MSPASIIEVLWSEGFTVEIGEANTLFVGPSSRLHDRHRELLRANKPAILEYLRGAELQSYRLTCELLLAAMKVCDRHGDSEAGREQMRADCLATPEHLRADLLAHLRGQA